MTLPPASIGGIFSAARQGMFASQIALRVAGQNIANVNTPGYSRQRVIFDPSAFGNGVSVRTVQQIRDHFLDAQLSAEKETLGFSSAKQSMLAKMELIFNETTGNGVDSALTDFFTALQDLTAQPDGTAQRESVRTRGAALGRIFASARERLVQAREDADQGIEQDITKINGLAEALAQLNDQISRQTTASQSPNELIDQRQRLLGELSDLINVETFDDGRTMTVMVAGGQPLVEGVRASKLETAIDPANSGLSRVVIRRLDGQRIDITDRISGGEIGGLLEARDGEALRQMALIDRLAAEFVTRFNVQHRAGTGLDGVSGRDFFAPTSVSGTPAAGNTGGVRQTGGAVLDQSLLTFHDYEIRFTGAATYDLVDTTTGTTISSGNAYSPGSAIVFDGLSITLDNVTGPPAAGDVIRVNTYDGAAGRVDLDAAVAADLRAIAAGLSAETGDNRNAVALADLENQLLMNGGTSTFADFFHAQVTALGIASQQAERDFDHQSLVVEQVTALVDSLSGVSIDEESTNLIQFERAFQASSRVIVAVDEMMQTILSLV